MKDGEPLFTVGEPRCITTVMDNPSFIKNWARSQVGPRSDSAPDEIDELVNGSEN